MGWRKYQTNLSMSFPSLMAVSGNSFLIVYTHPHLPESNIFIRLLVMMQEFSPNSFVEDDKVSESSIADMSRFIPRIPMSPSPSMSHVVSIGQLLESVIFPTTPYMCPHKSIWLFAICCTPRGELVCRRIKSKQFISYKQDWGDLTNSRFACLI